MRFLHKARQKVKKQFFLSLQKFYHGFLKKEREGTKLCKKRLFKFFCQSKILRKTQLKYWKKIG